MIRPLADVPAISMCIQAICHRNIHLSKRAPRMNESRGSKRTKTKQKKEMNSQHSSSSDHSWPRHISAVSWTGHCDVFQNFKHTRDNFRGGGKIYQIFGKNKQTNTNPRCFALSKSLTVLSLWIVHPGSAIWTMQLECTLFCEPLVVETCKKEGLTH